MRASRAKSPSPAATDGGEPRASPMIAQYQALKARHPGTLLFFRMGDFYELFFEDAEIAAPALDIALTKRGRHAGMDIPMCGVPVHSAELYLQRLIRKGFKVAICEQLEDPAAARRRGSKALVARDVVRVVTPGTLTEDSLLDPRRHNYLAAIARLRRETAVAWVEMSTGAFFTERCDPGELATLLARIDPGEIVVPPGFTTDPEAARLEDWRERLEEAAGVRFDSLHGERRLCGHFGLATLEALGDFGRAELAAAGALLDYLELTQKGSLPRLEPPRRIEPGRVMRIDPATRRNLELTRSLAGEREGSLLWAVDRTVTAAGARLLADRLAAPLRDAAAIRERLDRVEAFVDDPDLRRRVRAILRGMPDLGRALSRLSLARGGPRDLLAVGRGLEAAGGLATMLGAAAPPLAALASGIAVEEPLRERLLATLVESPPPTSREGGFVRAGVDAELDRLRDLRDQGRRHIAALEARYREETGIPSLKIRHNNLLGYFVEVTATHRDKVPEGFLQRQSMANATRYATAELAELEQQLAQAAERALAREQAIYAELLEAVLTAAGSVAAAAATTAEIDVASALAELAAEQRWVRPSIRGDTVFRVTGGRHPVVEQALARRHERFVANDCDLSEGRRLWLLTGPNMAGKSTFLRQNALIAVLAQSGSFVPAAAAEIGLVDRLFSRVGAADDLARGRSTFMVEMVETATILHQATDRSLVILDEIGRGTATFDGLSLAWAVIEHLHDRIRCRGLFATHYHELTALAGRLPELAAYTMRVKEWRGEVVFLHEVTPGSADRSYGIHVARLAGLPAPVIRRARQVLRRLEAAEAGSPAVVLAEDLPLFSALREDPPEPPAEHPALQRLRALDPDTLSPREALDRLYELRRLLDGGEEER